MSNDNYSDLVITLLLIIATSNENNEKFVKLLDDLINRVDHLQKALEKYIQEVNKKHTNKKSFYRGEDES